MKEQKLVVYFKKLLDDSRKKKSWQGGVGVVILTLFVLSSVFVSSTVQALNQAAGNYGYYGGTYGYGGSTGLGTVTTSDQVPSAPTSLSSSVTNTTASLSWTAPTTTTNSTSIATGGGSISSYKFHYNTSSLSSCSGGTSSTPTSASTSLSGLTAGTTYYVAICATDNNVNDSAALTGSFTTTATGGGGTTGGTAGGTITTPAPTVTTPAATPTVTTPTVAGPSISSSIVADAAQLATQLGVARNKASEATYQAKVVASAKEFKVTLAANVQTVVTNFVTYGTSSAAVKLGSGERLALVRDALDTLGSVANNSDKLLTFLEQTANGQKPTIRNLTKEVAQAGVARDMFKKLTGKSAPDFKNAKDDLAWNTILYRIRFVRDLVKEKAGIVKFKAVFGKNPKSPLDWAVVRAWGYSLK